MEIGQHILKLSAFTLHRLASQLPVKGNTYTYLIQICISMIVTPLCVMAQSGKLFPTLSIRKIVW